MYYVKTINGKQVVFWSEYITASSTKKHKQRLYTDPKTGKKYMRKFNPYTGKYNRFTFEVGALHYVD